MRPFFAADAVSALRRSGSQFVDSIPWIAADRVRVPEGCLDLGVTEILFTVTIDAPACSRAVALHDERHGMR